MVRSPNHLPVSPGLYSAGIPFVAALTSRPSAQAASRRGWSNLHVRLRPLAKLRLALLARTALALTPRILNAANFDQAQQLSQERMLSPVWQLRKYCWWLWPDEWRLRRCIRRLNEICLVRPVRFKTPWLVGGAAQSASGAPALPCPLTTATAERTPCSPRHCPRPQNIICARREMAEEDLNAREDLLSRFMQVQDDNGMPLVSHAE